MSNTVTPGPIDLHPIVAQMAPSPEQLPAIVSRCRDVVVTAGAGTGKTRTLVARYLSLLAEGLPLRAIVAITFTNKAAREMRNRVREEMHRYLRRANLGLEERRTWLEYYSELDAARIGTIHGLCSEILRAHPAEARTDPLFNVLDEGQTNLLRAAAVRDTMAWASDAEEVVNLFALLGERRLQDTLDSLLRQRLEAWEALQGASDNLLETWETVLTERQQTVVTELRSDQTWLDALWTLQIHAALKADDSLEMMRRLAVAAISETVGNLAEQLASMRRLNEINLARGSGAAWQGGAEEKEQVKEALGAIRGLWRARANVLDLTLTPMDIRLAEAVPALRAAFEYGLSRYDALKRDRNALDFDDLEFLALALLQDSDEVRGYWQKEVASLLVDEFQDTNGRQRDLVRILNADQGRLFIVGDAKQSIYRFRGADVTVFRQERRRVELTGGVVYSLDTSYRAHRELVGGLNAILKPVLGTEADPRRPWMEPFSPLVAHREEPRPGYTEPHMEFHFTVGSKRDGALERAADALAGRLVDMVEVEHQIDQQDRRERPTYGDVAILCRASTSFGAYENALERAGIPFLTVAGRGFYGRPEVRDLLNALQALADPTDDLALVGLLRCPALGVSDVGLYGLCRQRNQQLWEMISGERAELQGEDAYRVARAVQIISQLNQRAGRSSVADLLKGFLDLTDYRAALIRAGDTRAARNVSKLLSDAQASGIVSVGEFLEYVNGLRESGAREGEARAAGEGAVQIMSIHAAKGLEFPVVVLGDVTSAAGRGGDSLLIDPDLGVLLPMTEESVESAAYRLAKLRNDDLEIAESARLLYVAATRAHEKLLLSGCLTLRQNGTPTKLGRWVEAISKAIGFGLAETVIPHDPEGGAANRLEWLAEGTAIRCVVYEPGYHPPSPKIRPAPTVDARPILPPPLVAPVTREATAPIAPAAAREALPERRTWRVVPVTGGAAPPGWVVGSLVHEALAAWQFPGDGFHDWAAARARRYGITDAQELDQVVSRCRLLLERLDAHPFREEVAGADRRLHEVPYSRLKNGQVESGVIDVLFRAGGVWTIVEFKTNRIPNQAALNLLLKEQDFETQVRRYRDAARQLLGEEPRCVLCLLDYAGEVRLESVPAAL